MTGTISPIETLLRSISNLDICKSLDGTTKADLLRRAEDLESIAKGIRDYVGASREALGISAVADPPVQT